MKVEVFFEQYGISLAAFAICAVIVTFPDRSPMSAMLGAALMGLNYYFSHRLLHCIPGPFNFHLILHHEKIGLPRWLELTLEGILEFLYFTLFPVMFQTIFNDWIIPFSVILQVSMMYTSYHIYNYSILGSKSHAAHHKNSETNFGPIFIDHLLSTNADDEHEDLNPGILNVVACTLVVLYLKRYFGWTDRVY